MQSQAFSPRWTTATMADAPGTVPMELSQLGEHVNRCKGSRDRWFALKCSVDAVNEFIAPRFVTSLVIVGGVFALVAMAF